MVYILNQSSLILFINNSPFKVEKTDRKYPRILAALSLSKNEQDVAILDIVNPKVVYGADGFEFVDGEIYYQNEKLPAPLRQKVLHIQEEGLPVIHFEKFWERLRNNPNKDSAAQLIDFLSYRELPLTEDGFIIAYKGIKKDNFSVMGNPATKVIQGKTGLYGNILNEVGATIEIERSQVCADREIGCHARSLHLGSLDYAKGWGEKVVIVRVDPADVVSVPEDCSFQKCRVCKYEVVGEYESEILDPVTDEAAQPAKGEVGKQYSATVEKIKQYLLNRKKEGKTMATLRNLQKSFNPKSLSRVDAYSALQVLGYNWNDKNEISL